MSYDLDENLSEMDRMLLGEIPVPVKINGNGKALGDTGYDIDVVNGAHVLTTMKETDKKSDKKGKLHEDENVSHRSHDYPPDFSISMPRIHPVFISTIIKSSKCLVVHDNLYNRFLLQLQG